MRYREEILFEVIGLVIEVGLFDDLCFSKVVWDFIFIIILFIGN